MFSASAGYSQNAQVKPPPKGVAKQKTDALLGKDEAFQKAIEEDTKKTKSKISELAISQLSFWTMNDRPGQPPTKNDIFAPKNPLPDGVTKPENLFDGSGEAKKVIKGLDPDLTLKDTDVAWNERQVQQYYKNYAGQVRTKRESGTGDRKLWPYALIVIIAVPVAYLAYKRYM